MDPATADALAVASTLLIRLATLWFAVAVGGVGLLWLGGPPEGVTILTA